MNNLQLQKLNTRGQLTINYCPAKRHYESSKTPDQGVNYVGHLESKERLCIQPAQLFNFS